MPSVSPVRFTVTGHGAPDGWRGAITGIVGPRELNAVNPNKLSESDYHQMTVVDANTIEFNGLNAAGLRAYQSGGVLQYNTPMDITGYSARMSVRARKGVANLMVCSVAGTSGSVKPAGPGLDGSAVWESTATGTQDSEWLAGHAYSQGDVIDLEELLRLTDANGRIVIDAINKKITRVVSAGDVALMLWKTGVYDLEMVSPDSVPVVTKLLSGRAFVSDEATI